MALINLPEISFIDADVAATLNNVLQIHSALTGRTLAPADPERLFLQSLCALIVQQRVLIDQTAKATLLRYAPDAVLDDMGLFTNTPRLAATAATTILRFSLSVARLSVVAIPVGTRVSTAGDPKRYFATTQYAEVAIGSTTVDVSAKCTEFGLHGNGYLSGQISQIVDPIAFVATASNTTTSSGGSDVEGAASYRQRIREAPESFSVAGPTGAYQHMAKTASPLIVDVSVTSPDDGEVLIVPLLIGGAIPDTSMLNAVLAVCNDRKARPLTDKVTAAAPTVQNYTIAATFYINQARSTEASAIQAAVTAAVSEYEIWQKSKLGRDIDPSELIYRMKAAGASRVTVTTPVYAAVGATAVAASTSQTITYGGLADD